VFNNAVETDGRRVVTVQFKYVISVIADWVKDDVLLSEDFISVTIDAMVSISALVD